ncbi:hypothetical protein ACF09J_00945 [Streptomyces sp. NPDC014889]|uniref:hypothetical protein n=1 Tax=Streptomyces sp. NPDC014889 TaxID=3364928 RepID=UPI0036FBFC66
MERDAWIMVATQVPHLIDAEIARKYEQLDDPALVKLYSLLSAALDWQLKRKGEAGARRSTRACRPLR